LQKIGADYTVSAQLFNNVFDEIVSERELFFHLHNGLQRAFQPSAKQQLIQCIREAVVRYLQKDIYRESIS